MFILLPWRLPSFPLSCDKRKSFLFCCDKNKNKNARQTYFLSALPLLASRASAARLFSYKIKINVKYHLTTDVFQANRESPYVFTHFFLRLINAGKRFLRAY
jgi:hypothetical protein